LLEVDSITDDKLWMARKSSGKSLFPLEICHYKWEW